MGAQNNKVQRVVDPGPLGDSECGAALEVFAKHATEGELSAAGFVRAMDLESEAAFGKALFFVASRGAPLLGAQEFVRFMGETTRGAKSCRLTHLLCAGVGAVSLVDPVTREPRYADPAALARLFEVTWRSLLSKHHPTSCGFDDDDDDDATVSGSRRRRRAYGAASPLDADPFVRSIVAAAAHETKQEERAREGAQAVGSDATALSPEGHVDLSCVARWAERHAPELADAWSAFARAACFGEYAGIFTAPVVVDKSEILGSAGDAARAQILCALGLCASEARGRWKRVYGSGIDGLSFYRLCHQILGWRGPTLLIVKASGSGDVFGAYLDEPWREWHQFYGGSSCLVFALRPTLAVCRPRRGPGSRRDFMYLSTKARFKGICIGSSGGPDTARILVPEQLGDATIAVRASCLTFESAPLAPSHPNGQVEIDAIEVWGVGDQATILSAARARDENRKTRAEHIRKAGTVDKTKFADSDFDREFLFGKTFAQCASNADLRRPVREAANGNNNNNRGPD